MFEVNEYITLKLVRKFTDIYIKGERFRYSFLLNLDLREDDFRRYDQANDLDGGRVNKSDFNQEKVKNTPEQEFSDHYSTMNEWVRNDYDTRLLQVDLAFPLLKKLIDAGNSKAKNVIKDEIIKQLKSGHPSTTHFLVNGKYLDYLSHEELISLLNLCNDNFEEIKQVGFHALFFGLIEKLGSQKVKDWREKRKEQATSRDDLLKGFIFFY